MLKSLIASLVLATALPAAAQPVPLFDGLSFAGWNGETSRVWRVEHGALVAGRPDQHQPRNEFLVTEREFGDFELTLRFRVTPGAKGSPNAGIQIRSQRVPNHHEMTGYQADIGDKYWGCLYDESRRNQILARPADAAAVLAALRPGDWNDYRILCEGPRIRLWLNGVPAADFTESDPAIPLTGRIGLQIHGGAAFQIEYKDLLLTPKS
jgi:hypothetical protein